MKTRMVELDKRISDTISQWELPEGKGKEAARNEILSAIRTKKGRVISLKKWHWVAAACLVGVVLSYAVFNSGQVVYVTAYSQQQTILLPDGSSAQINAGSKLNYNKYAWLFVRNVNLSGEGFFEVNKGSQFKVHTTNGDVKVLGTSFNVFSRKDNFQVTCYRGKVSVSKASSNVVITPGQKALLAQDKVIKTSTEDIQNEPQWISGNFSYTDTPLSDVLDEVERQYNISFSLLPELPQSMRFTGEWNKNMPVENVLDIVCLPFGLEVKPIGSNQFEIAIRTL